jgi:hypothetical protein
MKKKKMYQSVNRVVKVEGKKCSVLEKLKRIRDSLLVFASVLLCRTKRRLKKRISEPVHAIVAMESGETSTTIMDMVIAFRVWVIGLF